MRNRTPAMLTDPVGDLLTLLDIERLEHDLFRGQSPDERVSQRVFGGQVIAQALVAAYRTVPEGRPCHSLHAYFIRPGDPTVPIIYQVDHSRDGGSFTTRRIIAIQHGKQIFNMAASFHVPEHGWEHQHGAPAVAGPEGLKELRERRLDVAAKVPEAMRDDYIRERPIEMREVEPLHLFRPEKADDRHHIWFRVARRIDSDIALHHALLAYASDMSLLSSSLRPHGIAWFNRELMSASLDHALWFHAPFRFDDWHLYAMDSPYAGGGRSFNRGQIFDAEGRLIASVAQEGLMRRVVVKDKT
jgi:acyl-CoA thioesterase II